MTKNKDTTHPMPLKVFKLQKYKIKAGATPKEAKSDKLSRISPKVEVTLSIRAVRPSRTSKIADKMIQMVADFQC